MPVTETRFYGGSRYLSSLSNPTYMHPDVATFYRLGLGLIGSTHLRTPNVYSHPELWVPRQGRPMFYVYRSNGTGTLSIKRSSDAATLTTITNNQVAIIWLVDAATDTWSVVKRTINTGRTVSHNLAAVEDEDNLPETYDPFCFDGDYCEYLDSLGNEPLDGTDGIDEVVAPFYEDPGEMQNQYREAIRAADIVMPKLILFIPTEDCFEVDTNHPWYGTYSLSEEFYDALYGRTGDSTNDSGFASQEPWVLEYDRDLSFPVLGTEESSHFHHIHRTGVWEHGTGLAALNVHRYIWRATKAYGPPSNPTQYTLEIRWVMEHNLTAPAQADSNGGGVGDTDEYGALGGIHSVGIFTNELNSGWVDGSTTFTPAGFTAAHTFDRDDFAVSALAYSYAGTETGTAADKAARKGVHPQCVAMASLTMSWHSPIGQNYIPLEERRYWREFEGSATSGNAKNLAKAYVVRNGSPWLTFSGCADDAPLKYPTPTDDEGIYGNILFGHDAPPSDYIARAMTLGGSFPSSAFFEWLVWENGLGDGRTFLKPSRPGWSEACGTLDVSNGNCGIVRLCVNDGNNKADDADELGTWPRVEISPCEGHPDEPFEGIGGTHQFFKNLTGPLHVTDNAAIVGTICCVPTGRDTVMRFQETCLSTDTSYGDFNGTDCNLLGEECSVGKKYYTQFITPFENYDLRAHLSASLREIQWRRIVREYTHGYRHLVDLSATGTSYIGGWTLGTDTAACSSVGGANPVRALALHHDTTDGAWGWWGTEISATLDNTLSKGCGVGFAYENAANETTGWGIHVSPVDVDSVLAELIYFNGTTETVIDSLQLDGVSTDGVVAYKQIGMEILTATYTPTSGPSVDFVSRSGESSIDVYHADLESGLLRPAVFTKTTSSGASLSDIVISDLVPDFDTACYYQFRAESMLIEGDERYFAGYGLCEDTAPAGCGTPPQCNCVLHSYSRHRADGPFSHIPSPFRDIDPQQVADGCKLTDKPCSSTSPWVGDNPTYHGGPSPARCTCRGVQTDGSGMNCDTCNAIPGEAIVIQAPLPIDENGWVGNTATQDPKCATGIPLMCRGLDVYDWSVAVL